MRVLILLFVMTSLLGVSCRKRSAPSTEYAQAVSLHARLVGEKWDEAYLEPQMAEAETLLTQVNSEQLEFDAAQKLLERIRQGRARAEAELKDKKAALDALKKPISLQPSFAPASSNGYQSLPLKPFFPPDAGNSNQPESGMSLADFSSRFSGCFTQWRTVEVRGQGPMNSYQLKDIANCRERHAAFVNRLVLFQNNAVYTFIELSAVREERRLLDGGLLPDAGK